MRRRLIRYGVIIVGALVLGVVYLFANQFRPLALAEPTTLRINAVIIPHFQVGDIHRTHFGRLKYLSGIEYTSPNENLGGISGIRVLEQGRKFLSISDKGAWFSGIIMRDAGGKIIGIDDARLAPLRDTKGRIITTKKMGDAEGIEIFGDQVLVSFERKSRIYRYELDLENLDAVAKKFRPSIKKIKLPNNNGLEAITMLEAPKPRRLKSMRIATFSEHALDAKGNIRGFVSKGKKWKSFSVRAIGDFKITDATRLPDGDIAILERQFSIRTGPVIRIRKLQNSAIKPGALLDGEILFEADARFQIDNLEGLSAWVNGDGKTILTIVSDDNFSFLQRNLLLEFELLSE